MNWVSMPTQKDRSIYNRASKWTICKRFLCRDMETRLQLTEKGVSISVKENDVIAFNMSKRKHYVECEQN